MRKKVIISLICIFSAAAIVVFIFIITNRLFKSDESFGSFTSYGWFGESFALTPENDIMYVKDFTSGECAALCTQPNCTHESLNDDPNSKCTAVPPKDFYWSNAFYYDDNVYEIFTATNRLTICKASKDGSSRSNLIVSEDYQVELNTSVICENKLIFLASNMIVDESAAIDYTYYLLCYDIADNSLDVLMDFSEQTKFSFLGAYMYDDTVYCRLRFEEESGIYSCENGKLNMVYSNDLMGVCSFAENGFYFSVNESDEQIAQSAEIDFYDIDKKSTKKFCDTSGYVNSICPSDGGLFWCTDSSYDGTFDSNNIKIVYYSDGNKTVKCLENSESLKWDLTCAAGDNVILYETVNSGEWEQNSVFLCVKKEDFIESSLKNAIYLNDSDDMIDTSHNTKDENSSDETIFNEYGQADFEVDPISEDESYFENKTKLVWLTNYSYNVDTAAIQNEVNRLLDERGYDFAVQFVNHAEATGDEFSLMQDVYKQMISDGEQVDIFNSGMGIENIEGINDVTKTYKTCIDNGWFVPLNNYFETELGKEFYAAYPEWYWECLTSEDGNIYGRGITGLGANPLCVIFNSECLDKYGIDISGYDGSFMGLSEYLKKAYEQADIQQLVLPSYVSNYNEYCGFINYNGIYFNTETGCFENIFENDKALDYLKTVESYKKAGYIVNEESSVTMETAICTVGSMNSMYREFANAYILSDTYTNDNINMVAGISTASKNPAKAFELLALFSIDKEFADLLYNGIEGRNYVLGSNDEKVQNIQAPAFSSWLHTPVNPIKAEPTADDNQNMKADFERQIQSVKINPLNGFKADFSKLESEFNSISEINMQFYSLFYGNYGEYETLDAALSAADKQLKAAGIDEVLNELNKQYNKFKQQ